MRTVTLEAASRLWGVPLLAFALPLGFGLIDATWNAAGLMAGD
jgi:hypothetical protein